MGAVALGGANEGEGCETERGETGREGEREGERPGGV